MKRFIQNTFTKIVDYFTANTGRKIFFWGSVVALLSFILALVLRIPAIRTLAMLAIIVAGIGTLWDSMQARYNFLKKVRDIQYEHLKTIHEKQMAGEAVEMTSTFSEQEKKYLRRRKWGFVFVILFKVGLVIALFSLLLAV